MTDRYDNFTEAWLNQLNRTHMSGRRRAPRGQETLERTWVQFSVEDPLSIPLHVEGRLFHDVIGVLEGASVVGQFNIPELFTSRVPKFLDFVDDGVLFGSYGARVHGRLGDLVNLLRLDPDTRQAVLTVYDSRSDLGVAKRDIPCTIAVQFLRDATHLGMRVTMRSNDLWLGTPYDFIQFAMLQASVAQALGLQMGGYVHSVGSLHLYKRDFAKANQVERLKGLSPSMPFPLWDPRLTEIGDISKRARDLAFGLIDPETEFEEWAMNLL